MRADSMLPGFEASVQDWNARGLPLASGLEAYPKEVPKESLMILRQLLHHEPVAASYVFG